MGRRSLHTAEELRELIISASTELIQEAGLSGLSAREIARRINYSPGTLYNSFENLDDLVLTIEGRLLDRLIEALAAVPAGGDPRERVHALASCYLAFAARNPKLWNLLFEHHVPVAQGVPDSYQQKFEALMAIIEDALRPLAGARGDDDIKRSARVLWAGVHGISSLSAADKLSIIAADDAGALMDDLVRNYLNGFEAARSQAGS
ncbi:TetR/AcrR family transcriptional regulator [Hyphomicrobium sp.]|uniref:TetR/AcrR family transcriptional regulator n=1 Tax=Hyphomicrobium sp. TaxID=82 RepID=UPI0025BB89FD|nr:TetR/AcrR family transcriptional regulator [Hyphomicrobium sp.]MCC7251306.1 TetR/AcrR family transcriptional regulator [Hyphomicrobium sp.]